MAESASCIADADSSKLLAATACGNGAASMTADGDQWHHPPHQADHMLVVALHLHDPVWHCILLLPMLVTAP